MGSHQLTHDEQILLYAEWYEILVLSKLCRIAAPFLHAHAGAGAYLAQLAAALSQHVIAHWDNHQREEMFSRLMSCPEKIFLHILWPCMAGLGLMIVSHKCSKRAKVIT